MIALGIGQQLRNRGAQELATQSQPGTAMAVGQQSIVTNAPKAGWQCMLQESPDELLGRHCHGSVFLRLPVAVIFPLKSLPRGGQGLRAGAGLELAIARGWLRKHEPGTYVKFTQAGADVFA